MFKLQALFNTDRNSEIETFSKHKKFLSRLHSKHSIFMSNKTFQFSDSRCTAAPYKCAVDDNSLNNVTRNGLCNISITASSVVT